MNGYSAHLFIDVHSSLEQKKKKKLFTVGTTFFFFFFYHFTLSRSEHSFTLSSSLSSLLLSSLSSPARPPQAHFGTTCFFFFFSNPVSFTLFISLSALISSLSSSLSQRHRPDHHQVQTHTADLPQCTSLPPIHFRSVSVIFMWMLWVFDLGILFRRSADPLWVFDLDPLHVDVSVFIFDI